MIQTAFMSAFSPLDRVGQRDAAEHFVELARLAEHAFDLPAFAVDELDDLARQELHLRFVARVDAERAVQVLDPTELAELFSGSAVSGDGDRTGQIRHAAQLL